MKHIIRNALRWVGSLLLLGMLLLAAFTTGTRLESPPHIVTQARSLGPTVSQLEKIGELASARIDVTDILMADGEGFRGAWLIKGDALLACNVSRAKILNLNPPLEPRRCACHRSGSPRPASITPRPKPGASKRRPGSPGLEGTKACSATRPCTTPSN